MRRDYDRCGIIEFGHNLLDTGDLDPVYIALPASTTSTVQLHRWLIAYWCFYHCGVASWLSEHSGPNFWHWMVVAARNTEDAPVEVGRWPRGSERRHFRGAAAILAVRNMEQRYGKGPQNMVNYIQGQLGERVPYTAIADRAMEHPLFGPWISFKIADMLERIIGVPVDFSEAEVFMFKDPVEAALMLWRQHEGLPANTQPKDRGVVIAAVVDHLREVFKDRMAPPNLDRSVGLQEIETILCKWKSHMNGHYPLYNDIDEISEGLVQWCKVSPTARRFLAAMPPGSSSQ